MAIHISKVTFWDRFDGHQATTTDRNHFTQQNWTFDLKNVQLLLYDGGLIMRSLWKRHKTWLYYKNGILRRNWAGAAYTGLTQLWEKEIQQLKTPKKFHVTCVYVKKFYIIILTMMAKLSEIQKKGPDFPSGGSCFPNGRSGSQRDRIFFKGCPFSSML